VRWARHVVMVAVSPMVAMEPVVAALALGAACGAKPPEPLEAPEPAPSRASGPNTPANRRITRATVAAPRPAIDISPYLPDLHHALRWPLSGMSHPVLEPQFPIARELAIDVDWEQLCARGVHLRTSATQKELLSYLGAWCEVLERDIDNACARLKPLLSSTRRGLASAVRRDLANILTQGNADAAEHWISRHDIRDVPMLDLLAANFAEVGLEQDAFVINARAIDTDAHASDATKCRRLVKRIMISHEGIDPKFPTEELRVLATRPKVPDPVCRRLYNAVTCHQNPVAGCWSYHTDENIDARARTLVRLYHTWPRFADSLKWWRIGHDAFMALPLPGAVEFSITAFEASLAADSGCTHDRALEVHLAVDAIRRDPANAAFEPRLARLAAACTLPELPTASPPATAP
jgi:hypothetical protein